MIRKDSGEGGKQFFGREKTPNCCILKKRQQGYSSPLIRCACRLLASWHLDTRGRPRVGRGGRSRGSASKVESPEPVHEAIERAKLAIDARLEGGGVMGLKRADASDGGGAGLVPPEAILRVGPESPKGVGNPAEIE